MTPKLTIRNCGKQLLFTLSILSAFLFSNGQNAIVTENAKAGTPSATWTVPSFRDTRISGFATNISAVPGETVRFKINVQSGATYTAQVYRLGYYAGNGARLIADLGTRAGTAQPEPNSNATTGLIDCSNWSESLTWAVPAGSVSGFYIVRIERTGGGSNHIMFVVRNDGATDILMQIPDATYQAYNGYGGNNFYDGTTNFPAGHAVEISYNRPFFVYNSVFNTDGRESDWYMNAEYPMIRWLERNGYNVSYTTSVDVASRAATLLNRKIFISSGHDEYVSAEAVNNITAARDAGVNLAFFSGNEIYWKTRWKADANGNAFHTLVCYKEGLMADGTVDERVCGGKCDVSSPIWTGLWRTGADYDAGKPENKLTGQLSWKEYYGDIKVPYNYKKLRFWNNTAVETAGAGTTITLASGSLGYEWDPEQGFETYPAGRVTMSNTLSDGKTHKLSLYRAPSGALVFGAGTIQWAWGLDGNHLGNPNTPSADMQQATVNLFADMSTQPATLQADLVGASKSTDATAPTSIITAPANGATFSVGANVSITGTATDAGGGVVGVVEVSTDGGATWQLATMSDPDVNVTWSFAYTMTSGAHNIRVRSTDDSGNIGSPGAGITINTGVDNTAPTVISVSPSNGETGVSTSPIVVANFSESINAATVTTTTFQLKQGATVISSTVGTSGAQITLSPTIGLTAGTVYTVTIKGGASGVKDLAGNALAADYSWTFTTGAVSATATTIFKTTDAPASGKENDGQGIELGLKFRSTTAGYITGIRYYKTTGTTGTHLGHLWSATGTQLGEVTFTTETATGWQQALFTSPIAIAANTTYVASFYSPSGDYVGTGSYLTTAITNAPLKALAHNEDGSNGIYRYGATSGFPSNASNASFYWVDVVYNGATGPDVTAPTVSSVTPANNATGVALDAIPTATFSESVDAASVTATTFQLKQGATVIPATVSTAGGTITLDPSASLSPSTVYTVTIKGTATGVKDLAGNALAADYTWTFTTVAADVTAPTVSSVTPANNATGITTGTTATATFSEAVAAASVTTTTFQLKQGATVIPATVSTAGATITLTPSAALTASTVYTVTIKGTATGVKDLAGNALAADYTWTFTTVAADVTAPTVGSVTPANNATAVATGTTATATFSEAIAAASVTATTFQLKQGATVIPATVSTSGATITLTPSAALTASTVYTVTIKGGASGVKDLAGNALAADYSWTFTTGAVSATATTIFKTTDAPASGKENDGQGIELGLKFRSTTAGYITGIRYYKTTGTTGTHLGHLWSATGTQLGEVTFTTETATGWQQALFTSPIAIAANTTYVASFYSPSGDYVGTGSYLTTAITNAPLKALAHNEDGSNGIYRYGATSGFPSNASNASFYWVDVVYNGATGPDVTAPTVSSVTPANNATGVALDAIPTATFSESVDAASVTATTFQLKQGATVIPATVSTAGGTITLDPSASLSPSTVYTVTIKGTATGVKDLAGNALAADYTWTFTTVAADVTAPTVSSVTPANNATGITTGTTATATFSEAVAAASVTTTTFQLKQGATVIPATVSTAGATITLTPSAALTASTVYTVTIKGTATGVKDLAGNALAADYTWTFTTVAADVTAPTVGSVTPANNATAVATGTTATATFSEAIAAASVTATTFQLKQGATVIPATVSTSGATITLTPSAALTASTVYTVTIKGGASGVKDLAGNALAADYSWTFTTGTVSATTVTIFKASDAPVSTRENDGQGIELGLKFRSTTAGYITGIRYYKPTGATGTHLGHLWNATGTQLGEVTFTTETATGWQQALFTSPIAIAANTTYVASYYSPSGDYVGTGSYLTTAVTNAPLKALAHNEDGSNGIYKYGVSGYPANTTNGSFYWVDVVYAGTGGGSGNVAPAMTTQPASQGKCANTSVSFVSAASGTPAPTVQWQSSPNGTTWTAITGATSATYTFTAVAADNAKQFRAVWTNSEASVTSTAATLTISAIPAAPTVAVVNNCGTSTLTAGAFTGTLLWSNSATTTSIAVTNAAAYTVTQTIGGCTSGTGTGTSAPKATPSLSSALTKTVASGVSVAYTPTSATTGATFAWTRAAVTGISNAAASGTGATNEVLVNTTAAAIPVTYVYTTTANGCSQAQNVVITISSGSALVCSVNVSQTSAFNTSAIASGRYIWFNSVFDPGTLGTTGTTNFYVTNAKVTFTANSIAYSLAIPNSNIKFSSTISSASSAFTNGVWVINAPIGTTGNIFMGGLSYLVPVAFPASIQNVVYSATVSSDKAGLSFAFKWAAAVYSTFAANAGVNVKPIDGLLNNPYFNTDVSATPENFKTSVIAGAKGTGGSNYTGTYTTATTFACSGPPQGITGGTSTDSTGSITGRSFSTSRIAPSAIVPSIQDAPFEIAALPNPSATNFTLVIKGRRDKPVDVRVVDVAGRVIERRGEVAAGTTLTLGSKWHAGMYFVEVTQDGERKMVKLIKVN